MLKTVERPIPVPASGEILIKVHASGVNRPDLLQRQGKYPPPTGITDIPGLEVAGEVVGGDIDSASNPFRLGLGSAVCALVAGGGYAEYVTAPLVQCLPIPKGWSFVEAAGIPETFFTVWSNVFDRGGLALGGGGTLLVQGGASGIGVTAIQLAKALGHTVYATAGTDDKCLACQRLGAASAFNYRTQDFAEEVQKATHGRGVDVVLDMVAGSYVPREMSCLADDGRIVIIALLGGASTTVDLSQILRRRLTITGSALRPRSPSFKGAIAARLYEHVWPLMEEKKKIVPVIHKIFPAESAADAHVELEEGHHVGKIILQWI